jgi:glutamyl/glutaminyl-tRNA synthetase
MRLLTEFVTYGKYLFKDPIAYDIDAVNKHLSAPGKKEQIEQLMNAFKICQCKDAAEMESCLRDTADRLQVKAADLIHPLRIAVTGFGVSPGVFEVCETVGLETVIRRLNFLKIFLA